MKIMKERMDEGILVCVYYGPNGERLIQRGCKLAKMLDCPLYILTVDPKRFDDLDAEKTNYIARWKEIAEHHGADAFILKDDEKRPVHKVIAEVAREKNVTQIVIGQTAQSLWEQIAKGSIINALLKEIPFVDLHIISIARYLKNPDRHYEKGIRAYLVKEDDHYRIIFKHTKDVEFEGIFFKELGTDFNNGVFKFISGTETVQVQVNEDIVLSLTNVEMDTSVDDKDDFL